MTDTNHQVTMIWAMDRNRTIGLHNALPWRLPADLAFFRRQTKGHTVLMGRKTYESIGKPLAGRTNVILTANRQYSAEGCIVVHSIEEALKFSQIEELFVIGGAEIYKAMLPYADRLFVTCINESFEGDAFFPEIDEQLWELADREVGEKNEKNPYEFAFLTYVRKAGLSKSRLSYENSGESISTADETKQEMANRTNYQG